MIYLIYTKGSMIYLFSMHQNFPVQSIIQVMTMLEQWLEKLIIKFGLTAIESDASRVELHEFVKTFEA